MELVGFWVKISIRDIFSACTGAQGTLTGTMEWGFSITAHQSIKLRFPNHCSQYSFGRAKCLVFCRHLCYSPVPGCLGDICHGASWKEKHTYFLINSNSLSNGRRVKGGQAVKCKSLLETTAANYSTCCSQFWGALSPACSTLSPHLFTQPHLLRVLSPVPAGFIPGSLMLWLNHSDCMG